MSLPPNEADRGLAPAALTIPEVLEERLALVAAAVDGPVGLGTYTDEELAALDGLATTPAQPTPWYSHLDENEKQLVMTAALRGLTARGAFVAEPVTEQDRTYRAHVDPGIGALITMRRYVPFVVVGERTTSEFVDWALLYPQRAGTVLAEYVDHRGLHLFELASSADTMARLSSWVGGDLGAESPDLDVRVGRAELEERPEALRPITEALFATTFVRQGPQTSDERWTAVYAGTAGVYTAVEEDGGILHYRGAGRTILLDHLSRAIA